jgi:Protein of unknown function (DUF1648)
MTDAPTSRLARLAATAGAIAVLPFAWAALVWSDLPDPIATHWTFSEAPDGHTSKGAFFLSAATVVVILAIVATVSILRDRRDRRSQRLLALYALGGATFVAAILGLILSANHGAPTWQEASQPAALVVVPLVLPLAVVALAARLVPVPPIEPGREPRSARTTVGLSPREHAVWFGGAHSRGLLLVGPALAAGTLLLALLTAMWWLVLLAVVVLLAVIGTASVSVRIDAEAVRVGFGPLRWPAKVVRLSDVTAAEAIDVKPVAWGGWGYRWVPSKHATAAVVRRGPGLRLDRTDGRVFVVTVDDADRAAGLVNDLLDRRGRLVS